VTESLSIQVLTLGMIYTESHNIGPLLYVITHEGKYYVFYSICENGRHELEQW